MMEPVVLVALGLIGLSLGCCLYRIVRGPSHFDRVLAFDSATLNVVGAILLDSILIKDGSFMDVVLVVTLLGFLGTIALTAYLEGTLGD